MLWVFRSIEKYITGLREYLRAPPGLGTLKSRISKYDLGLKKRMLVRVIINNTVGIGLLCFIFFSLSLNPNGGHTKSKCKKTKKKKNLGRSP